MIAAFKYKKKQNQLFAKLFTRHPALVKMWTRHADLVEFSDSPWTGLTVPASQSRLALVTTGGVHLLSQSPFNMQDPSGDPQGH
jgi:D-proline reductase (dithiol) PrdB